MQRIAVILAAVTLAGILVTSHRPAGADDTQLPALLAVPAAPGSLAPRLAAGENGALLMSWLEPESAIAGHALRYSEWASGAWQAPKTVATGDNWFVNWADFPSVVPVTADFWVAHWLVRRPAGGYAYDVHVAISDDAGASWQDSFPLHADDTDTEHGFVSIFPDADGAGVVWLDGRHMEEPGRGMTLRTVSLRPDGSLHGAQQLDGLICDCCQTDAIVTESGPIVAYRDRTEDEIRDIYVTRRVNDEWLTGAVVAADDWQIGGCPVNGPALARDGANIAVAWFTAKDDQPRVRLARAQAADERFGTPVDVVVGDTYGRVGVVLLPDGSAVVSTIKRMGGGRAQLVLVPVASDGRTGAPFVVATEVNPISVPQLILHGDQLITAWTIRDGKRPAIRSAVLPVSVFIGPNAT